MNSHRSTLSVLQPQWQAMSKAMLMMLATVLVIAQPLAPALSLARNNAVQPSSTLQPVIARLAARQPDRLVDVIVQYGNPAQSDTLRQLVRQWGGQLNKDLSLIRAFSARMPASMAARLADQAGVRQISLDAPMYSSSAGVDGTITLVEQFDDTTYVESQTTTDWPSGSIWSGQFWTEISESDGPDVGSIALVRFLGGQYRCGRRCGALIAG